MVFGERLPVKRSVNVGKFYKMYLHLWVKTRIVIQNQEKEKIECFQKRFGEYDNYIMMGSMMKKHNWYIWFNDMINGNMKDFFYCNIILEKIKVYLPYIWFIFIKTK